MAVTLNAKGTSVPYFRIGKSGITLFQGGNDPDSIGNTVRTNDIWLDTQARTLKFRKSDDTWQVLNTSNSLEDMSDVDLTGVAEGYVLRYNSTSQTWEPHEVAGGLASDWGSITENALDYDGYTGDVWQVNTTTSTAIYNNNIQVDGYIDNSSNTGAMMMPVGTTAQRPSLPQEGMVRFNSDTSRFEGYNGDEWLNIDIVDDWGSISGTSGITYNYDFSNISYVDTLTFNLTDTSGGSAIQPRGAFVHPDGTYYFWTDPSTDKVYRSEMSTAYDITSISGTPQTLSVSTKEGAASDVFLGDSGTKLYITGSISDKVHQYDLSTAYDLTTASFNQSITTKPTGFNEATPWSLHFKSDGTKMYVVGGSTDSVGEWDLSTAWDISTATFSQSFSFTSQSTAVDAFTMSADGTKMYHGDGYNGTIYRYSLSTAWDVSTASYDGATDLRTVPNAPSVNTYGICFDTAGDRLYVTDFADKLHQFSLE